MSHDSFAPLTCFELLPVWLDRIFWMSRRFCGHQLLMVQNLVTHEVPRSSMIISRIARILAPPPVANPPSNVCLCQNSVIRRPTPKVVFCLKKVTVSKILEELAREVARVQGQPAGKEEDGRDQRRRRAAVSAEVRTGGLWKSTPPFAHADRSFDVSRWKVERVAPRTMGCERRSYLIARRTFLKWMKWRAFPLVEDVEIDGALVAYSNNCSALVRSFVLP